MSFDSQLYELVHDVVDSDKLLKLLNIQIVQDIRKENPEAAKIIDEIGLIEKILVLDH